LITGIDVSVLNRFKDLDFNYKADFNQKEVNIAFLLSYAPLRMFRFIASAIKNKEALKMVNTQADLIMKFIEYNLIFMID
jgi:hypothetical protein